MLVALLFDIGNPHLKMTAGTGSKVDGERGFRANDQLLKATLATCSGIRAFKQSMKAASSRVHGRHKSSLLATQAHSARTAFIRGSTPPPQQLAGTADA